MIGKSKPVPRRKKAVLLSGCLLALAMAAFLFSGAARAAETRTVRVAFFPMDGYHEKTSDGTLTGMDVEYLKALCSYVNWDIEYVECSSWDDALSLLSRHEADLVGSAQYSPQRAEVYQYADLSSGYTYGVIAARPDSSLAYEDFDAMRDIPSGS